MPDLDSYYKEVKNVIMVRQHPISGLLPASTAINEHGDYRDAWVRDNVYSILAVWALALAYRKSGEATEKAYELEQSTVKLMRGLLSAMMRQSSKVEAFKESLNPLDALHAKYNTSTGETVVADNAWGHLQLDASSLYLLMVAQMTASGLAIIYTLDEVAFIQNLVFYVSQAYRTPDYGIWERGDKTNEGEPELNASSVAMAKAALEAMSGLNLFGVDGSQASVIHVIADDIAKARITLQALLPRESSSKEVDAALLSAIGFPAFAIENQAITIRTRTKIIDKLMGNYGLKRFLRDGHQTVVEDSERLYYQAEELKMFETIESEWPLFYTYLALDALFRDDQAAVETYLEALDRVAITVDDYKLLPELYFVPKDKLNAERKNPGSQERQANDNLPLVWAQSLWIVARLLNDKCISLKDIDPLTRHENLQSKTLRKVAVQVALIAEDEALREELAQRGFLSETIASLEPVKLRRATLLTEALRQQGQSKALSLSGRPHWRMLSLSTSKAYNFANSQVVFPPAFLDSQTFYLSLDTEFLVERFSSEIAYLSRNWSGTGRPTVFLLLTHSLLDNGRNALLKLLESLLAGKLAGVDIKVAATKLLLQRAAKESLNSNLSIEAEKQKLDTPKVLGILNPKASKSVALSHQEELKLEQETNYDVLRERLKQSQNAFEQVYILELFAKKVGLYAHLGLTDDDSVELLLEALYEHASSLCLWPILRRTAGLLRKVDVALMESVADILVAQKAIVIGKAYTEKSLIRRPIPFKDFMQKMNDFCREDVRDFVLTQELLIYLSLLIKAEPKLFKGFLTIRIGHLILLLVSDLAAELTVTQDSAYDSLMHLPPSLLQARLRQVLANYSSARERLEGQEAIQVSNVGEFVRPSQGTIMDAPEIGWWRWRQREGVLNRVPKSFYARVWFIMEHSQGLVIGDKLDGRNRLSSKRLLSEMTAGEKNFALTIDHLLNRISAAEYRQLSIEALMALWRISESNPTLHIQGYVVLDVLIGHAVRYSWTARFPELVDRYDQDKAAAWASFYELSPQETSDFMVKAFEYLLKFGENTATLVAGD